MNFSWLAKISTGRRPILKGLLPPIGTLVALLASAFMISGALALWTGVTASAALFLPFYAKTFFAVCGFTVLNFVFSREIHTFMYSTREVRENFVFDKENPTDLRKLVNHVRMELNAYFRKKYGDKHVDMPMPRLLTYTDPHFELETVEGMNPWHSALLFSTGVFNSHETGMDQRDLAAILAVQLAKIYLHRGSSHVIVRMGVDLLSTLENFRQINWFTRLIGSLTWPLEFLFLFERSVRRSHEYEAASVVADLGRGMDLIRAYDRKVCPTLFKKPTTKEMRDDKANKQRPPYQGPLKSLMGPVVDWAKKHLELPEDHRDSMVIWVAINGLVREFGFHIRELWSKNPRTTRLKDHLREFTKEGNAQTNADLKVLHELDKKRNNEFYQQIPATHRYEVIGPEGRGKGMYDKATGKVMPRPKGAPAEHHHHHAAPIVHLHEERVARGVANRAPREDDVIDDQPIAQRTRKRHGQ